MGDELAIDQIPKAEIAREIKEIFSYVKSSNRDNNVLANACRRLKNKSEAGYRGLLRLLNRYGYLNVILDITNNIQHSDNEVDNLSNISFVTESMPPSNYSNRDMELDSVSTVTTKQSCDELPNSSQHFLTVQRRDSTVSEKDYSKSERYARTKYILSKTGLLGIADKTKELLKKNKQLQKDIDSFKQQTETFLQCVLANPQNQRLVEQNQPLQNIVENVQISSATSTLAANTSSTMASVDSSEFAGMLSGIFDIELPNVIFANLPMDNTFPTSEPITSDSQFNLMASPSSPPRKRVKRHTN